MPIFRYRRRFIIIDNRQQFMFATFLSKKKIEHEKDINGGLGYVGSAMAIVLADAKKKRRSYLCNWTRYKYNI